MNVEQRQAVTHPQTKPTDSDRESAFRLLSSTTTIPNFPLLLLSPKADLLLPSHGG